MTQIDPVILYMLITEYSYQIGGKYKSYQGWIIVQQKLTSADDEDGGGHYDLILKNIEEDKCYKTTYCDWDIDNTDFNPKKQIIGARCDLDCSLTEVVPVTKTVIEYKTVK